MASPTRTWRGAAPDPSSACASGSRGWTGPSPTRSQTARSWESPTSGARPISTSRSAAAAWMAASATSDTSGGTAGEATGARAGAEGRGARATSAAASALESAGSPAATAATSRTWRASRRVPVSNWRAPERSVAATCSDAGTTARWVNTQSPAHPDTTTSAAYPQVLERLMRRRLYHAHPHAHARLGEAAVHLRLDVQVGREHRLRAPRGLAEAPVVLLEMADHPLPVALAVGHGRSLARSRAG